MKYLFKNDCKEHSTKTEMITTGISVGICFLFVFMVFIMFIMKLRARANRNEKESSLMRKLE